MIDDRPNTNQAPRQSAQVLQFQLRRRGGLPSPRGPVSSLRAGEPEPTDDLARYEAEDVNVDYRHRMVMNMIAVVIVTFLVGVGVWITDTIGDMEKAQDCVLQGRQNCEPISVPIVKK